MRGVNNRTPERVAEAQRLRAEGLTYRQIADSLGDISLKTVAEWLTDPDRARAKARREGYQGECIVCGATTCGDIKGGRTYCRQCQKHAPAVIADRQRRREGAAPRRAYVQRRWNEGASMKTIASELGIATGNLSDQMDRMRSSGWDLPHRYAVRDGNRAAA